MKTLKVLFASALALTINPALAQNDATGAVVGPVAPPRTNFTIGGDSYENQCAANNYALTSPDAQTLRFEIHPGDRAWFDGNGVDRCEAQQNQRGLAAGTPVNLSWQFMLAPNSGTLFVNSAWFFVVGEMHHNDVTVATSPPFAIQLAGNKLQVVARYVAAGGNPQNGSPDLKLVTLWTDPNPFPLGQYVSIRISANVSNTGGGYLQVWVNNAQVVNYSGLLGYGGVIYWEEGLYRNSGPTENAVAYMRSLTFTTGASPPPPPPPPAFTAPSGALVVVKPPCPTGYTVVGTTFCAAVAP